MDATSTRAPGWTRAGTPPTAGVVPLKLVSGTVIGAVGVSGLPQLEDHAFVVGQLRAFLAR